MPVKTKNSTGTKSKAHGSKMPGGSTSAADKKRGTGNVKVPSTREKIKNFDEGRRGDANSNEL